MITATTLKNPIVLAKIKQATKNCINGYYVDHVHNKRGDAFLAIRVRNGKAQVLDGSGRDLTQTVSKLL